MTTSVKNSFWSITWHTARHDLLPFDGRFAMAWRVAAQCSLATLVFMTYGIPLAAIGCYLILFLMKQDSAENSLMAIGLTILVALVVVMLLYLVRWTIDYPMWRIIVIAVGSFIFIYIGAASQLGEIGNVLALVVGFAMTLLSDIPFGEVATRALLYAWLMTVTPMAIIVIFNLFLGRSAVRLLKSQLTLRLATIENVLLEKSHADTLQPLLQEGNEEMKKRAANIKLLHLISTAQTRYLISAIDETYRLLLAVTKLDHNLPEQQRLALAAQCHQASKAINEGYPPNTATIQSSISYGTDPNEVAKQAIDTLLGNYPIPSTKAIKTPAFFKDALTNRNYPRFAIKTTAAALICYIVYTAIDWQGIHTAMITCYVAALGTTAETVHKLTLRIIGCLIGAAMGVASILFLIPHMTSIFSLMLLVFIAILIAGWVSSGSERIAYAGIQIGLAFLLTVLQGFGPDISMSAASDRIIGILLGNVVMYLIFTRIWPQSIYSMVHQKLNEALNDLSHMFNPTHTQPILMDELSKVLVALHEAKQELKLSIFEPRKLRLDDDTILKLNNLITQVVSICQSAIFITTNANSQNTQTLDEVEKIRQLLNESEG